MVPIKIHKFFSWVEGQKILLIVRNAFVCSYKVFADVRDLNAMFFFSQINQHKFSIVFKKISFFCYILHYIASLFTFDKLLLRDIKNARAIIVGIVCLAYIVKEKFVK